MLLIEQYGELTEREKSLYAALEVYNFTLQFVLKLQSVGIHPGMPNTTFITNQIDAARRAYFEVTGEEAERY